MKGWLTDRPSCPSFFSIPPNSKKWKKRRKRRKPRGHLQPPLLPQPPQPPTACAINANSKQTANCLCHPPACLAKGSSLRLPPRLRRGGVELKFPQPNCPNAEEGPFSSHSNHSTPLPRPTPPSSSSPFFVYFFFLLSPFSNSQEFGPLKW